MMRPCQSGSKPIRCRCRSSPRAEQRCAALNRHECDGIARSDTEDGLRSGTESSRPELGCGLRNGYVTMRH